MMFYTSTSEMSATCTTSSSFSDFKDDTETIGDDPKVLVNHDVRKKHHTCATCGAQFDIKRDLTIHRISIHPGEKPFKCDLCGMCFAQSFTLKTHLLTHTGEKPFKYDMCASCFAQRGTLETHIACSYWRETFQM